MIKTMICALMMCVSASASADVIQIDKNWQFDRDKCHAIWLDSATWMMIRHESEAYLSLTFLNDDVAYHTAKWQGEMMITVPEGESTTRRGGHGTGHNAIGFAQFVNIPIGWLNIIERASAFTVSSQSMKPVRIKGPGFARITKLLRGCYYSDETKTLTVVQPTVVKVQPYIPAPMIRPPAPTKQNQSRRAISPSQRAQ